MTGIGRGAWMLAQAGLLAAALGPLLDLDQGSRLGLLTTYPPRLPLLALGAALILVALMLGRRLPLATLGATTLLGWQLGWGGGAEPVPPGALTVLSYNIHHNTERAADLAALCAREEVDLLVLQEVRPFQRPPFVEALGDDYRIVLPDEEARFAYDHEGPFSSLIAVRRTLLGPRAPRVDTAITGYRTYAARLVLDGTPLWVVNVHTTKAFWLRGEPLQTLTRAGDKASRHLAEQRALEAWLERRGGEAVLVAGDFNAPLDSRHLRLPGLHHAHLDAGSGPHLSIPAGFPIWGLDHVLGSEAVRFHAYRLFDPGWSDHRAQLARFSVVPAGTGLD